MAGKCLAIRPGNDLPTLVCTFLLKEGQPDDLSLSVLAVACKVLCWVVEVLLAMYGKFVLCLLCFKACS